MTTQAIQKMIETETLLLSKGQLFWHYCIIGFFLIPPIINIFNIFEFYVTHTYKGVRTIGEMATWSYIPLIPALVFYYIQKNRLKFKVIDISIQPNLFIESAKETANQLEWNIIKKNQNFIVAKSDFSWRSWGELITIIRVKDKILFNSICDPDNIASIASWGKNKINFKTFDRIVKLNM